ncbi:MAG TPA: zinc ribbon domain-containing protein [Gammaproteobacteria bacterium]|jgi:putative FmdB family regulatory protein|nr:zinc ribbon domain-containing protein [Gammaproteobacteria bacterium]
MPIYEYQCTACGHTFDTLRKISEPPLTRCPECGAEALKKLISPSAFRLKGGGWYETDFKTGTKKNVAGGDKPAKGGSDKPAKGGSDKPAATGSGDTSKPKK